MLDGSTGDVAGGGEGCAVEFRKGVVVDVDFAGHTERREVIAGLNLDSNKAVVVRCGLLPWFRRRGPSLYTQLWILEHPEQQASDVLGMLSMP